MHFVTGDQMRDSTIGYADTIDGVKIRRARVGRPLWWLVSGPELVKVFESSGCLVLGGDRGLPVAVGLVGGLIDPGGVG